MLDHRSRKRETRVNLAQLRGMGRSTRDVELKSVDDLDERQIAAWMKQVAAVPGVGGKKR